MRRDWFKAAFGAAAILTMLVGLVSVVGCSRGDSLTGSIGLGDSYLPNAGNGGYEVARYQLDLTVDPVSGLVDGTAVVQATAEQDLTGLTLDFSWPATIASAEVGGRPVEWKQSDGELAVTLPERLAAGDDFSLLVRYSGLPESIDDTGDIPLGWQKSGDIIYTLDEPAGAATWFPVNDHPSDKAIYSFRITVPKPYVAAANGVLVATEDRGTDWTFAWEMTQPMASYLASVTIADYAVEESVAPNGVAIRNYFDQSLVGDAEKAFARTGEILTYFAGLFGPYPFDAYGVAVPAAEVGAAMENQTLSLYGEDLLRRRMMSDAITREIYLSHELAHQWFGDSVTIKQWEDVWLNEGFATYASFLWLEHDQGAPVLQSLIDQSIQLVSKDDYPPLSDPGLDGMFSANVYRRGALTLHALRLTIGDPAFFALLKEWASRYKYGSVSTQDFTALAKEIAVGFPAERLDAFFDTWLNSEQLPALPMTPVAQ